MEPISESDRTEGRDISLDSESHGEFTYEGFNLEGADPDPTAGYAPLPLAGSHLEVSPAPPRIRPCRSISEAEWIRFGSLVDLRLRPCPYLPIDIADSSPRDVLVGLFSGPQFDRSGGLPALLLPHDLYVEFLPQEYGLPAGFRWPEYTGAALQLHGLGIRNVNILQYGGYRCLCCGSDVEFCTAMQSLDRVVYLFYECTVCFTSNYTQHWRTFGWYTVECAHEDAHSGPRLTGHITLSVFQFCFAHHTCGQHGRYPSVHSASCSIDGPSQSFLVIDPTYCPSRPYCPRYVSRRGIVPSRRGRRRRRVGRTSQLGCRFCSGASDDVVPHFGGQITSMQPSRRQRLMYSTRCHFWRPRYGGTS